MMELENISNDDNQYIYTEGHVDHAEFAAAVLRDGYDIKNRPVHEWLVEREIPEEELEEYCLWFEFCEKEEPGAFPVTCLTL